jgi:hypothetical protein
MTFIFSWLTKKNNHINIDYKQKKENKYNLTIVVGRMGFNSLLAETDLHLNLQWNLNHKNYRVRST